MFIQNRKISFGKFEIFKHFKIIWLVFGLKTSRTIGKIEIQNLSKRDVYATLKSVQNDWKETSTLILIF